MQRPQGEIFGPGKRYYTFSHYLKNQFGEKVWKIPVHAGFTCPNRDGKIGWGGCIYCNNEGFGPGWSNGHLSIAEQVKSGIRRIQKKRNISKFLVYFQTYTNTYDSPERLKQLYDQAVQYDEVVGLAIGTRPDCVTEEILDVIESYTPRLEVWVEYGLQSIHNRTLRAINRGHTYEDFLQAIELTRKRNLKICVHVIVGLPGESKAEILATAAALGQIAIDGIKIHPMQVHRNTKLEQMYDAGEVSLFSMQQYIDILCDFLERLPSEVVIQRLTAEAPANLLIAPEWCLNKIEVIRQIAQELEKRDAWQATRLSSN